MLCQSSSSSIPELLSINKNGNNNYITDSAWDIRILLSARKYVISEALTFLDIKNLLHFSKNFNIVISRLKGWVNISRFMGFILRSTACF